MAYTVYDNLGHFSLIKLAGISANLGKLNETSDDVIQFTILQQFFYQGVAAAAQLLFQQVNDTLEKLDTGSMLTLYQLLLLGVHRRALVKVKVSKSNTHIHTHTRIFQALICFCLLGRPFQSFLRHGFSKFETHGVPLELVEI